MADPPVSSVAPFLTASRTSAVAFATAFSSISGPIVTPSSVPRPMVNPFTRSVTRRANSSAIDSCTMNRLAAVQAWPMLRNFAAIAPSTALSRSASSKSTNGALPPSSIEVRRMPWADCWISCWPTAVDPVKLSFRRRGSAMIDPDTAEDREVVMTFTTPAGRPASSNSLTRYRVVSGVSAAGLITTVQPAASAGAILRVAMASGKFHGVIRKLGPTGCCDTIMRPVPSGLVPYRPHDRVAAPGRAELPDHPVELPAGHGDAQDRPGARRGLHRRDQAGRAHPADHPVPGQAVRRGRPARRRRERHHDLAVLGRVRGAHRRPSPAEAELHRVDRGRPGEAQLPQARVG